MYIKEGGMTSKFEELKKLVNMPYHKWHEDMFMEAHLNEVPPEIGCRFQGHGISKGYFDSQAQQLDNLLTNGIDPNRVFYTAPYAFKDKKAGGAFGTAGGTCYKDGLFVVLGEIDDVDFEKGIKCVVVNKPLYDKIEKLSELYPDVIFVRMCEVADYMQQQVQKKDLPQVLNEVIATNDVYQNPDNGLVGFVPKKGVSNMEAYESLSKLKAFGLVLSLTAEQQSGSRLFYADPKAEGTQNAKIISGLAKALNRKEK